MDAYEVIGAFVDRERVDPEALTAALATDDGRQYLLDLVSLREMIADEVPQTGLVRRDRSAARWLSMAAAIVVTLGAGYVMGQRHGAEVAVVTMPSPVVIELVRPISAPSPTKVIRLEPGVNWKNAGGD